ncbi:MAG: hypothetical protein Q7R85_00190 [bacterium]|nr:hypothetical protein [bacterium]
MKNTLNKLAVAGVVVMALAPLASFAIVGVNPTLPSADLTLGKVTTLIGTIANWIFAIFLAVAVVYILYAAYLYLKGEEAEIEEAKKRLIAAAIAIAIALLAKGIQPLVENLLGSQGQGGAGIL